MCLRVLCRKAIDPHGEPYFGSALHSSLTTRLGFSVIVLHARERAAVSRRQAVASRVVIVVVRGVAALGLGNLLDVRIKLDELVGDINQPRAGVASEAGKFDSNAFVSHGVDRVSEV